MKLSEAAKLVGDRTHVIYWDSGDSDLLKKVLKKAFPLDEGTDSYDFPRYMGDDFYGYCRRDKWKWANIGAYLTSLQRISLSEITEDEDEEKKITLVLKETQNHYDNSKGSLYQFCEDKQLNSYEFDIIKRIMRCRKKGQFKEDLEKTKFLIDLYLTETNH